MTSVERTVVDLSAASDSRRDVRALAADVVQRRLTLPSRLVREMARRPSLPGLDLLADVLTAVADGARSVLEIELREHLLAAGIQGLAGRGVVGASGKRYWADAVWPEHKLIVEVDGREWHFSPDDWERDLARTADLTAAGYRLLRFTAHAIRRRTSSTVATVRQTLALPIAS